MNERRKAPKANKIMSEDEVARSLLEWDPARDTHTDSDLSARTYNFLNRLDHPDFALGDDGTDKRSRPQPSAAPSDGGGEPLGRRKRRVPAGEAPWPKKNPRPL